MNIAQLKQSEPIDSWTDFDCQIKEVKEIKQRTKSSLSKTPGQQYNVQKLIVQDDTDTISIWAYAKQQFLSNQIVNVRGMLKEYKNVRYLDYCDVKLANQTAPPQAQQAPQQSAQATNPPQTDKAASTWQPLDREHVEKDVICALLAARNRPKPEEVKIWADYIMSGIHPDIKPQAQNNSEYASDGQSGICPNCQKPLEDCICDVKF